MSSAPGVLYVVPSPSSSRGMASRSVAVLRGSGLGVLEHFRLCDAIVVGLGHEPDQKPAAVARLRQINPAFNNVTWTLLPVFQKSAKTS